MSENEKPLPDLLTVTEAAKILRVTSQAVRDMIKRGDIEAARLGRQYRIPKSEIVRVTTTTRADPADAQHREDP